MSRNGLFQKKTHIPPVEDIKTFNIDPLGFQSERRLYAFGFPRKFSSFFPFILVKVERIIKSHKKQAGENGPPIVKQDDKRFRNKFFKMI